MDAQPIDGLATPSGESAPSSGLEVRPADRGGIVDALVGPLAGRNAIARDFYDGPGWRRFRVWERLFLAIQGGQARARRQILRHLGDFGPGASVIEVGVGDGANLALLSEGLAATGVDIARRQLEACAGRIPAMRGRLWLAEAESLPFDDATFDAGFSVGGFNYYRDHRACLAELSRVVKPGGRLLVADEDPRLIRLGIGHLVGLPRVDAWWLRRLGLDRAFAEMILDTRDDPEQAIRSAWPDANRHRIWSGLGYCYSSDNPAPPTLRESQA